MIERLVSALRAFVREPAAAVEPAARTAGDYLDAYRLILDCPQYEVGAALRAALDEVASACERRSGDGADIPSGRADGLRAAAGRALLILGESPTVAP